MAKYNLSARGLERVMRKLLEVKLIAQFEFDCPPVECDDTVLLDFELPDRKK